MKKSTKKKIVRHLKENVVHDKKLMKSIKDAHKKQSKKKHKSDKTVAKAMKHKDVLGAGAKKRKHLGKKHKVEVVMKEFKRGTLHSGGGSKVTNPKQAIAIALSEARKSKKKK